MTAGPPRQDAGEGGRGSNLLAGLLGLAVAGLALLEARGFPFQSLEAGLGAAFVPALVIGSIATLGVLLCLMPVFGYRGPPVTPAPRFGVTALLLAMLVAFAVGFAFVGLMPALAAFLIAAMRVLGAPWRKAVLVGTAAAAALYGMFVYGFGLPLP